MSNVGYTFLLSLVIILLGYLSKRIGIVEEQDSGPLTRVILNITLPALIIRTVSGITLDASYLFLPLFCIGYSALVMLAAAFLFRRKPLDVRGLLVVSAVGYNIGLFAYPLVEALYGQVALFYLATFDIGSAITNFGLSFVVAALMAPGRGNGGSSGTVSIRSMVALPAKSVPLLSYFVAIAINISGLQIPLFLDDFLLVLASGNQVLVLLMLGILLRFAPEHAMWKDIGQVMAIRYGTGLLVGIALFALLPFGTLYRSVLLISLVLPVSMIVVPYAVRFGYRRELAGTLVNATIVASYFIMWLVVIVLERVVSA